MAITRDEFKPGLVWAWDGDPTYGPYLVLGRSDKVFKGQFRVWWPGSGNPGETPAWQPALDQLGKMVRVPHTPESLVRWVRYLKETEGANVDAT